MVKPKEKAVPAAKLNEKLLALADGAEPSETTKEAPEKKKRGRPPKSAEEKENDAKVAKAAKAATKEAKKAAAAKAAKAAKDNKEAKKASRKTIAMGKAAAVAAAALKRPASQFVVDEDPSSRGSFHKHEGGRPAKRQARAMLHSRFDAVKTPGGPPDSPDVLATAEFVAARWPADSPEPVKAGGKRSGGSKGRYGQLAEAATAAANAARAVIGTQGEKLSAGRADGAWSSAYRTLQAAHIKLQTKYDKLKDTKLKSLMDEEETYRAELADHGAKAEELINHFRGEATRRQEEAAGAEAASARVYELERENAELKESLLAHQGKVLRVEQEAAAATQRAEERARASSSGRWGSEELEAFTGLRWVKQDTGVHRFTHAATGFSFQLSAADPEQFDDDDDAEAAERKRRESDVMSGAGAPADEVSFEPIEFGAADGYLPGYLSEAIEFERCEMPEFVGRMLGVLNQVAAEHVAPRE